MHQDMTLHAFESAKMFDENRVLFSNHQSQIMNQENDHCRIESIAEMAKLQKVLIQKLTEQTNKIKVTELFKVRNQIYDHFLCLRKVGGGIASKQPPKVCCSFETTSNYCDLCRTTDKFNMKCKHCAKTQCSKCLFELKLVQDLQVYTERIARLYQIQINRWVKQYNGKSQSMAS